MTITVNLSDHPHSDPPPNDWQTLGDASSTCGEGPGRGTETEREGETERQSETEDAREEGRQRQIGSGGERGKDKKVTRLCGEKQLAKNEPSNTHKKPTNTQKKIHNI